MIATGRGCSPGPSWFARALTAAVVTLAGCGTRSPNHPPLTILAAASLATPFQELADSWRAR